MSVSIIDNAEQLDVTDSQAAELERSGLIYRPEPETSALYTTSPDVTLDDVEAYIAQKGRR
jgi:hypothetical protein